MWRCKHGEVRRKPNGRLMPPSLCCPGGPPRCGGAPERRRQHPAFLHLRCDREGPDRPHHRITYLWPGATIHDTMPAARTHAHPDHGTRGVRCVEEGPDALETRGTGLPRRQHRTRRQQGHTRRNVRCLSRWPTAKPDICHSRSHMLQIVIWLEGGANMAICTTCKGRGRCPRCNGSGKTGGILAGPCPTCRGKKVCPTCNGTGRS
jgi:hypothetical protein